MAEDDWGAADAFDGGDYPVLGDVAAPSAPGKRAKRTFNKQQHTLDAMAAGTVTLERPKGTPLPLGLSICGVHGFVRASRVLCI